MSFLYIELPAGNISVPLPVSSTDKNIRETAGIVVGAMSLVLIIVAVVGTIQMTLKQLCLIV